jgi:hypothetical protein
MKLWSCAAAAILAWGTWGASFVHSQQVDMARVLRNAIPVDANGNPRSLQQNYNGYQGYYSSNTAYAQNSQGQAYEYANSGNSGSSSSSYATSQAVDSSSQVYKAQLTPYNTLKFNRCLSLRTEPEENSVLFDNYLFSYTKNGKAVAQQSYVLFNVCGSDNCYQGDESNLYMVPLADYLSALVGYMPAERNAYCQMCEQAQDYCVNGNRNGYGNRDLKSVVQCSRCFSYGCFNANDDAGAGVVDLDTATQWVQNYVGCQKTGQVLEQTSLYAGFMCNSDGTGAELALFLDESCSIYTSTMSFSSAMDADAASGQSDEYWYSYMYAAKPIVQYPFTQTIKCSYLQTYDNNNNNNNNGGNNNAYRSQGANQYCLDAYQYNARSVSRCREANKRASSSSMSSYYNVNQQYSDYNNNQYEADGENANGYSVPSWYKYDLTSDESSSTFQACKAMAKNDGKYIHSKVYDKSASGQNFQYKASSMHSNSNGMKPFFKFVIFAAVLGSIVMMIRYFYQLGASARQRNPLLIQQHEADDYVKIDHPNLDTKSTDAPIVSRGSVVLA